MDKFIPAITPVMSITAWIKVATYLQFISLIISYEVLWSLRIEGTAYMQSFIMQHCTVVCVTFGQELKQIHKEYFTLVN